MVSEHEALGGSTSEFAAARRLNASTFANWVRQLRREREESGPRLLPVRVSAPSPQGVVEVCVAGVLLRVPGDVDAGRVAELVQALESRTC
jgi:transposase-like protein